MTFARLSLPALTLVVFACLPAAAQSQPAVTATEQQPAVTASPAVPAAANDAASAPSTAAPVRPAPPQRAGRGAVAPAPQAAPPADSSSRTASATDDPKTAETVRIALILSLMAILPAILLCMTSFVRIVVVLAMIRHGLGMPETPPSQVLISLAIFLTIFSMLPTFQAVNERALQPFLGGQLSISQAIDQGSAPARDFMLRQVRDQDIKAIYDIARKPLPNSAAEVGLMELVPAFMLNELRVSFRIGFVILLPFLLIDLVVSSILLALGMLMVPPSTLSLPIKVLMFVLIDGWSLVLEGVLGSFR
jgi:flagellar biosynthetic protein FliP